MNLTRSTLPEALRIGAPAPDKTGILHLGLGQFHRAHAAVNTALALAAEPGDWGIVGVANRSRRIVDGLKAQDFLYSILQLVPGDESVQIVDVHRRGLVAADDGADVIAAVADPAHKIVTMTISEKGYHRTPAGTVDLASFGDEVTADVPSTPLGLLARGLQRRYAEVAAPIAVLSCDNVQGNGAASREVVLAYLTAAGADDATLAWVGDEVAFPNAMVDRIVPGTTDETRAKVEQLLGLRDEVPVPAERFSMWVLEDRFPGGRPQWEAAGAIFSDEVDRYELVKLRILNGMHSLISYLGALDGRATIPASRQQPFVEDAVRAAIYDECLPSIELPTGFDFDAYVDDLFVRWSNTSLGDKTARVGSDGSTKLLQRIPTPALRLLNRGEMPQEMALTLAGWVACVCPPEGFDPGPIAAEMDEPLRPQLAKATDGVRDNTERVQKILDGFFPAELAASKPFAARAGEFVDIITTSGVRPAAAEALASRPGK